MVKLHMKFNKRIQNCTKTLSMSYGCLFKDIVFTAVKTAKVFCI